MHMYRLLNSPRQVISKYPTAKHFSIWRYHNKFWRTSVAARGGFYNFWQWKLHFINEQRIVKKYWSANLINNGTVNDIHYTISTIQIKVIIAHFPLNIRISEKCCGVHELNVNQILWDYLREIVTSTSCDQFIHRIYQPE